jgi:hypothetical protein
MLRYQNACCQTKGEKARAGEEKFQAHVEFPLSQ